MDPLAAPGDSSGTVALTRDDVKTLSSDTRVEILKKLGERRMTVTELAQALDLSKATVLEHLEKLVAGGFIRRLEDDKRVWIYYDLAEKGRRVVFQSSTRFVLLLSGAGVAAIGGAASFALWLASRAAESVGAPESADDALRAPESSPSADDASSSGESAPAPMPPAPKASPEPSPDEGLAWSAPSIRLAAGITLLLVSLALASWALRSRRTALRDLAAL